MLEYLSKLIETYDYSAVKQFHAIPLPDQYTSKYTWKHDNNGYTVSHENTSCYIDKSTGIVHKLSCLYSENDYVKHLMLYDLSSRYNYRIEIPLHSEYVLIKGKSYLYTIVQRPNKQLGIDYNLDILNDRVNNEYFVEFIDNSVPLFKALYTVGEAFNNMLPSVFILPTKRLRDDQGYFYFDFKKWHHPKNTYIRDNSDSLMYMINYCIHSGIDLDRDYLKQHINNSWTIE